jgi:tetratricopeptide (TPR) repeat protein
MARKKRAAGRRQATDASPRPASRLPLTRKHLLTLAGIVTLLGVGATLMVGRPRRPLDVSTEPFPAAPPVAAASLPEPNYVGSDRCASCHQQEAAVWRGSTHARAGGAPNSVRIVAPFDGTPIRFSDAEVIPGSSGGRFTFTVRQAGATDHVIDINGVVGGGHMEGGGTQGFVSQFPDGTWRFVPFDYSRQGRTWFCNTIGRANRGWVPITPALSITDCVDWPPARVLGDEPRFSNCQSCHGSQITVQLDTAARVYRTTVQSLGIGCESCHGAGGLHVARAQDPASVAAGDLGIASLATLDKDQSLGTCWQCHALKDRLRPGQPTASTLADHYSVRLPLLGDNALFADGRVRTFAYQEGHLYSDCYRNGRMTCTSCHDPHSQSYRDVSGVALPGRFDDRQCTSCHASKADSAASHTRHSADSPGSRCTSCHMPYLQQPELGTAIRYARSDHSIAIPRPAADSALGIVGACRGCHADMAVRSLESTVARWYGALKPLPAAVEALQRVQRGSVPRGLAARLLLNPDEQHTQALFAGMAWFLEHYLSRDMADLERDAVKRLEQLAAHGDDDVQALALASLHVARGTEPRTRRFLIERLGALGHRTNRVRARWGVILGYLGDRARSGGDLATAVELYRRAREADPRSDRLPLNHGLALAGAGDLTGAIDAYRDALEMDPVQPLALVNLGIALAARQDVAGARAAYARALALNPREPLAWYNLAALQAASQPDTAIANFMRAADLDPSLAEANFNASRLLLQRNRPREALARIEAGLRFDPSAVEARMARDQLRRQTGPSQRP